MGGRRPLLLHLPVPCWPITPDHVWWSVPTRALMSPRMMSFSDFGTAAISASSRGIGTDERSLMLVGQLKFHYH